MGEAARNRRWIQWILAAIGLSMIAAAVWIVAGRRAPAPSFAAPLRPSSERVSLYVMHDGPALRLHWNSESEAIRRARSGALVIGDGPRQSRLELTPEELRSGAASYWPESPGVNFKLELDGAVAGEVQAPALAERREEEPRPSPFGSQPKKHKAASRRAAIENPDADMPKPHTVRAADAPRQDADRQDSEPRKPSKWRRVTGKIPLLRRLHR